MEHTIVASVLVVGRLKYVLAQAGGTQSSQERQGRDACMIQVHGIVLVLHILDVACHSLGAVLAGESLCPLCLRICSVPWALLH